MRFRDTPQSARPGRLDLEAGVNLTPMPHWTIRVRTSCDRWLRLLTRTLGASLDAYPAGQRATTLRYRRIASAPNTRAIATDHSAASQTS